MDYINELHKAVTEFDYILAIAVFVSYIIIDFLYGLYTWNVAQLKSVKAANYSFILHIVLAFGVINYVHNFLYVIPVACGSWIGTYISVNTNKKRYAEGSDIHVGGSE